jgi:short-subunit dehydrogenase
MTPVAVVTGASAGIGLELARVFAKNGHAVAMVARRERQLVKLAGEISASGAPKPLVLPIDLAQPHAVAWIANALAAHEMQPEYIVNNAGFGLAGTATELDHAEQLAMIDLNVRTLTELSLAFIQSLQCRHGGILNVASVAGFFPGPRSAVYYASKAYVLSLSEALHAELMPLGVRVTCLCPGPVATEFQARAGIAKGKVGWPLAVSATKVATAGYRGLMAGQRLVVPGWGNKLVASLVPRLVPRRVLLRQLDLRQSRRHENF